MITRSQSELAEAAAALADAIRNRVGDGAEVSIESGIGRVGGGALPMSDLPGPRVAVRPRRYCPRVLEQGLRLGSPPVITLVKEDAVLMDSRTLLDDQPSLIPGLVQEALYRGKAGADM